MAIVGTVTKQPNEVLDVDINYVPVLPDGVTISGTPTATVSPSGVTVSTISVITGNKIKFTLSGGTDGGGPYVVTVRVTTSSSPANVYEDEVNVIVEEIP
jgi:hypothetical protein